jgi:hypothetical protein
MEDFYHDFFDEQEHQEKVVEHITFNFDTWTCYSTIMEYIHKYSETLRTITFTEGNTGPLAFTKVFPRLWKIVCRCNLVSSILIEVDNVPSLMHLDVQDTPITAAKITKDMHVIAPSHPELYFLMKRNKLKLKAITCAYLSIKRYVSKDLMKRIGQYLKSLDNKVWVVPLEPGEFADNRDPLYQDAATTISMFKNNQFKKDALAREIKQGENILKRQKIDYEEYTKDLIIGKKALDELIEKIFPFTF